MLQKNADIIWLLGGFSWAGTDEPKHVLYWMHRTMHYWLKYLTIQVRISNSTIKITNLFIQNYSSRQEKASLATYVCCNFYYKLTQHLCYNFIWVSQHIHAPTPAKNKQSAQISLNRAILNRLSLETAKWYIIDPIDFLRIYKLLTVTGLVLCIESF